MSTFNAFPSGTKHQEATDRKRRELAHWVTASDPAMLDGCGFPATVLATLLRLRGGRAVGLTRGEVDEAYEAVENRADRVVRRGDV